MRIIRIDAISARVIWNIFLAVVISMSVAVVLGYYVLPAINNKPFKPGEQVKIEGLNGTGVVGNVGVYYSDVYFQDAEGRVTMIHDADNAVLKATR